MPGNYMKLEEFEMCPVRYPFVGRFPPLQAGAVGII